jgi:hypothetical protein
MPNTETKNEFVTTLDILDIVIGKNLFSMWRFIYIITGSMANSSKPQRIYMSNWI